MKPGLGKLSYHKANQKQILNKSGNQNLNYSPISETKTDNSKIISVNREMNAGRMVNKLLNKGW